MDVCPKPSEEIVTVLSFEAREIIVLRILNKFVDNLKIKAFG